VRRNLGLKKTVGVKEAEYLNRVLKMYSLAQLPLRTANLLLLFTVLVLLLLLLLLLIIIIIIV
jgi:hypothetical protein